jgi:hypothetical protein
VRGVVPSAARRVLSCGLLIFLLPLAAPASDGIECTVRLVPSPDTDGDGLTDGQEQYWETDPNDPDTDNDRMNDGDEVFAGTQATNYNSNLRLLDIASGTNAIVRWTTVAGRSYEPYRSDSLLETWTNVLPGHVTETNEAPEGEEQAADSLPPAAVPRFYRIRVLPP